jgi:hypothetical protein
MYYKLNVCSPLITKCDPLQRKEALVANVESVPVRMAEMIIFAGLQWQWSTMTIVEKPGFNTSDKCLFLPQRVTNVQ